MNTYRMLLSLLTAALAMALTSPTLAIDSGSDGSDGALTFPAGANVDFDPAALGIDADGDHIFHFTTIDIPAGTTVKLRANILGEGRPITWLASGDVSIAGTIDLSGGEGNQPDIANLFRAEAGAGGYSGGLGEITGRPATSGGGPGGAVPVPTARGAGGGHRTVGGSAAPTVPGGLAYGNQFLLPLTGGSGGAGGSLITTPGAGGGGGGGAILIASSGSITFTAGSAIDAKGGGVPSTQSSGSTYSTNSRGGGGAGGAVRLVADSITGEAEINVRGGYGFGSSPQSNDGGRGWIRIEALLPSFLDTGSFTLDSVTYGHPGPLVLPPSAPSVRVTQVGANPVTQPSTGSFVVPDVTIDEAGPVTLTIEANNIPLGTTVNLVVRAEDTTTVVLTSTPLTGTFETSTATAGPVTLQHGFSRFTVHATFNP